MIWYRVDTAVVAGGVFETVEDGLLDLEAAGRTVERLKSKEIYLIRVVKLEEVSSVVLRKSYEEFVPK